MPEKRPVRLFRIGRRAAPRWLWWAADIAAIAGLLFFALYYLTSFRFHDLFTNDFREVDFIQWHRYPPLIAQYLQYPSAALDDWRRPFPYLPSAVAMLLPLSKLPESVAFDGWIALQAVSLAIALWAGLKLSGAAQYRARLLIALAAVLLTDNQIGWDFRTHNTNVIYLALIMLGLTIRSAWLSGLLLGISCNLKIYSGVLVGVFIWRREYRLAASMLVATALIAIALPIAVFGFSGYFELLGSWLGEAFFLDPPPGRPAYLPANLLRQSGALLVGGEPSSLVVSVFVRMAQAIWIALVLGYFALAPRPSGKDGPGGTLLRASQMTRGFAMSALRSLRRCH
jgi:hypothetical protein